MTKAMSGIIHGGGDAEFNAPESKIAPLFVVFFFALFCVQVAPAIVPVISVAMFMLYAFLYRDQLFLFLVKNKTIMIYPLVVLLSAAWSSVPFQSFSGGVQLCVTMGAGVLMGVSATPRQLIRGLFLSTAAITVVSIVSGRMGASAAGPVLVGVTGSKDQMGFVAMTLMASAVGVLFDRRQRFVYRLSALALAPVGAYVAVSVQSSAPMIAAVGFPVAFLSFFILRYFRPNDRALLVVLLIVVAVPLSLTFYAALPERLGDAVLHALNKNTTLTGRTMLWEKADQWIASAPELGYGYRSFWVGNSADATGMLHHFGVDDGRAFQFHHTIREILVDTGWIGLLSFALTVIIFLRYVLADAFLYPSSSSAFIATMYILLVARSSIETIVIGNYVYTSLFYACGTAAIVSFMNRSQAAIPYREGASYRAGRQQPRNAIFASKYGNSHRLQ
jgi:exopolysaccharide production protein ExoQ